MFDDFNYAEYLKTIDALIADRHYGSYTELINLTPRELQDIVNTIVSKQREEEVSNAMGAGGGEVVANPEDFTPEMLRALQA